MSNSLQLIAALVFFSAFIIGFNVLGKIFQRGVSSLGRNPLASGTIERNMLVSAILVILVMGIGLGLAYYMFTANPAPSHSRADTLESLEDSSASLPDNLSMTIHTTSCFTVALPFNTQNPRLTKSPDQCTYNVSIIDPRGQFTLTHHLNETADLEDHPSVLLRRRSPETYINIDIELEDHPELLAFQGQNDIVFFLKGPENTIYEVAFHEISSDLENILSSSIYTSVLSSLSLPPPNIDLDFSVNTTASDEPVVLLE